MFSWKTKYEDLLAKVEPFMEQIDAYEVEKQALIGKESAQFSNRYLNEFNIFNGLKKVKKLKTEAQK